MTTPTQADLKSVMPAPLPEVAYEPRIWSGRVWTKEDPFVGTPFLFKAPYGVYMNALQLLGRAMATRQITRFQIGPATTERLRRQRRDGEVLVRYEQAFERLALQLAINWSA